MADENMIEERAIVTRGEAKAAGQTRYWTGKPCKHGHIAERSVANGVCAVCMGIIERKHREGHPEKFREKWRNYERAASPERREQHRLANAKWSAANQEKIAERGKKWTQANPERKREHGRRWRDKNLEFKREQVRIWREAHRENKEYKKKAVARAKAWAKENPEGVRRNTHARRARLKGASGSHTKEQLLALLKVQNWKCAEPTCGISLRKHRHLDHIQPLSKGGSNDAGNLQYLCVSCNCRKHNKDPIAWAQENGRLL